ncbi:MAG: hypothetical protein ABSF89_16775 [Acidimicrobiales bacterium]
MDASTGHGGNGGHAFTYNGSSWSAPVAVDKVTSLVSVSCPTTSFCAAVGDDGSAFTYNGSSWTTFSGVDTNPFEGVSCASSSFCVAVDNSAGWDRTRARCPPFGSSVSPARPPNRLCGIPHNRLYVESMVMLKIGPARCVFAAEGGFSS